MALGEVGFFKIPDVDDVAVEDQHIGLNGFEVGEQLSSVAPEGSKVEVAQDDSSKVATGTH
jgi:hypothetical protein